MLRPRRDPLNPGAKAGPLHGHWNRPLPRSGFVLRPLSAGEASVAQQRMWSKPAVPYGASRQRACALPPLKITVTRRPATAIRRQTTPGRRCIRRHHARCTPVKLPANTRGLISSCAAAS